MPGGHSRSDIGRSERAVARRNKIHSSNLMVNMKEMDRNLKVSMRQLGLERQSLFTEMDVLETRSGWLKDAEKAGLPPGYVEKLENRAPFTWRSSQGSSLSNYSRKNSIQEPKIRISSGSTVNSEKITPPGQMLRSYTDMLRNTPDPELADAREGGNRPNTTKSKRLSISSVRFKPQTVTEENEGDLDIYNDDFRTATVSPSQSILSVGRRQSAFHLHGSSALSDSSQKKSMVYIPSSDPRYRLLNIPVQEINVRNIKEHTRKCQRLRSNGKHAAMKTLNSAGDDGTNVKGEYIPKRVKQEREERLRQRRERQEAYNNYLVNNALAKFKEMYVVPGGTGLVDANNELVDVIAK